MKLTEHFTLAEMTISQEAARRGLANDPNADQITALRALCQNVLEPVRTHFGAPLSVSSGFRAPRINKAVGGSATSQHPKGEAADFIVFGQSVDAVFDYLRRSDLPFDQVIHEFGQWVHVSHRRNGPNRREALYATYEKGKKIYRIAR